MLPLVLMVLIYVSENSQGGKEAGKQQPVVILLGWGGCRDKNLAKYSAIYHKRVSTAGKCLPRVRASANLSCFVGTLSLVASPLVWNKGWPLLRQP